MTTQSARQHKWLGWALLAGATLLVGLVAIQHDMLSGFSRSLSLILSIVPLRTATVTLYYRDAERGYWIPVSRFVRPRPSIERAALEELIKGPQAGSSLAPTIPQGVTLRNVTVRSGVAHLELSGCNGQPMARDAIVLTLTSLPGIKQVALTWDGKEREGPLSRPQWINAGQPPAAAGGGSRTAVLYFFHHSHLVPITRQIARTENLPAAALQEFLNGPRPESGLTGPPPGIQLLGLHVANGVAYVRMRFDSKLQTLMERGVWNFYPYHTAVIYTLTEFPQIQRVQFDLVGLTLAALSGCQTPLSIPLARPVLREHRSPWLDDDLTTLKRTPG